MNRRRAFRINTETISAYWLQAGGGNKNFSTSRNGSKVKYSANCRSVVKENSSPPNPAMRVNGDDSLSSVGEELGVL